MNTDKNEVELEPSDPNWEPPIFIACCLPTNPGGYTDEQLEQFRLEMEEAATKPLPDMDESDEESPNQTIFSTVTMPPHIPDGFTDEQREQMLRESENASVMILPLEIDEEKNGLLHRDPIEGESDPPVRRGMTTRKNWEVWKGTGTGKSFDFSLKRKKMELHLTFM